MIPFLYALWLLIRHLLAIVALVAAVAAYVWMVATFPKTVGWITGIVVVLVFVLLEMDGPEFDMWYARYEAKKKERKT